jgi:hypothetical protein
MRSSRPAPALLFGLSFALPFASCDCGADLGAIPEPQLEVLDDEQNSHLNADPWLVIAYGDVDDGQRRARDLTLRNYGAAPLALETACLVSAPDLQSALAPEAPCLSPGAAHFAFQSVEGESVAANGELTLSVAFQPVTGGPASVFLRIESNAVKEPRVAVQLTGRGTAGRLCADTAVLDFGAVYLGSSATEQITLENCGLRPVAIDTWQLMSNPDDAFAVALAGSAMAAPMGPLQPGDTIVLDVTFTPAQVMSYRGTNAGQAQLTTAAPFEAGYTLLFEGDGRNPPACRVNVVPQTVQFGAVAAETTSTQQLVIQSVGECACTVESIDGPTPADTGFSIPAPPTLPVLLRGSQGCEGDPAGAQEGSNLLLVELQYTAPERDAPIVDNATLLVTTTDDATPQREVSLEANGGGAPFCQVQVTPTGGGALGGLIPPQGRHGVVEFGRVTVHFSKKLPITLRNTGNIPCSISGVQWDVAANTLANEFGLEYENGTPVTMGGLSISLSPGQSQRFMAVFAPTKTITSSNPFDILSFGSYSGANPGSIGCGLLSPSTRCNGVKFLTNDTVTTGEGVDNGDFSIGFSATPVEPAIDVIPSEIDFGLVTLDCGSPMRRVNVYNTGSGDLVVGQPYGLPSTAPPTFQVAANAQSFPHRIPPGGSMAIDVRFYARQLGVVTGELIIPTEEGGQPGPPVSVPLRGEGTLETAQTDLFDQFNDPKVDVLWVVDDSGSMQPFNDALSANFPTFFTASDVAAADFHIAVTTTLALERGCIPNPFSGANSCNTDPMAGHYTACSSNDRFLTTSSSNPEGQFTCNARVHISNNVNPSRSISDSAEAGLQAARLFLSAPKINDPAINGGFLRDDAKLHVIIVADEPDQSQGPIDLYVDFFRNLKGFRNDSLVAVSAIAAPANGCPNATGDARYPTVVNELNGRFQSICDSDWSAMMSNLGLASLGLKIEFFLSRAADAATLSVCVRSGGPSAGTCTPVAQAAEGAANGYFYDPTSNSIVFNPGSVPVRGARVEVRYETFCY